MRTLKDSGLLHRFNTLVKWFLASTLGVMTILAFYQVVMRYVFNRASHWSEELVRFLFIWCTFIGAAIGVRERIHIGVDVFVNLLPKKIIPLTEILVQLGIMFFSGYMVYYGWSVVQVTKRQYSPALEIPMGLVYLAVPVMGLMLLVYCSLEISSAWKRFTGEGEV